MEDVPVYEEVQVELESPVETLVDEGIKSCDEVEAYVDEEEYVEEYEVVEVIGYMESPVEEPKPDNTYITNKTVLIQEMLDLGIVVDGNKADSSGMFDIGFDSYEFNLGGTSNGSIFDEPEEVTTQVVKKNKGLKNLFKRGK